MGFIFGEGTPWTYDKMQRQRKIADSLRSGGGSPKTFGQGLSSIGNALAARGIDRRADKREGELRGEFEQQLSGLFGGGPAQQQAGGNGGNSGFDESLSRTESGGDYGAVNSEGYSGKYQFGQERLDDFNRANGTQYTTAGLIQNPSLQEQVQDWHVGDIDRFVQSNGLNQYVGRNIGGVTMTQNGMRGMAHLGGKEGMKRYLQSGGQYNPSDSNGTSLSDYARKHGGEQQYDPQQLVALMANPMATPEQKAYLGALLQQQMPTKPMTEMERVKLAQAQLNLKQDRNAQPEQGFTQLTPDQVTNIPGLDPTKAYQRSPDGKISPIGGDGTNVTVNTGINEGKFSEEAAKIIASEAGGVAQTGSQARRSLEQINSLEKAVSATQGGAGAAFQMWLGNMGVQTEGLDDLQLAEALISQLVPQQRAPGSGHMSDADLALFKASLPRLINTPDGNAKIISTMRAIAEYDVEMGAIARKMLLGEITQRKAFDAYANVSNPLAEFAGTQGNAVRTWNPATRRLE